MFNVQVLKTFTVIYGIHHFISIGLIDTTGLCLDRSMNKEQTESTVHCLLKNDNRKRQDAEGITNNKIKMTATCLQVIRLKAPV